jgi:hypothetical protein
VRALQSQERELLYLRTVLVALTTCRERPSPAHSIRDDAVATFCSTVAKMASNTKPALSEEMLKIINGHVNSEDKKQQYQESLQK